ncbi:hypothetical protein QBC46DRAFT_128672 [Diplogelasinospora grovesii]|uniref:DUF7704 domain-containing protein n=1 Tax=Diplogelasinospora grovesii TaxID=303347 RepID=A0AAN6N6R5_9PEZI|nr:hypothetical protein QBC46DRAFT_128672 [Diplogelasinospora grovesii]
MADQKQTPSTATTSQATGAAGFSLPLAYRAFFLLIEPISALVGAYYAHFGQVAYLELTHGVSAPTHVPLGTRIALSQLANMYLFFAINEALVLRSTSDLRVWKTVLFCLLIGDFGHLYTLRELGPQIYWSVSQWNAIDWGNIAFVYLGASMRIAFLADVGMGVKGRKLKKRAA